MCKVTRILVMAFAPLLVTACGQKGDLVYGVAPGGTRASLGQSLVPTLPSTAASAPVSSPHSTPPLPLPER
jgi:hypothetical protein